MVDNLQRKLTTIAILFVVALVSLVLLRPRLGLDLEGGTRLVYSVDIEQAREEGLIDDLQTDAQVMEELISIWSERLDPQGVRGAVIRRVGARRVVIELPGSATAVARKITTSIAEPVEPTDDVIELSPADESNWNDFPVNGGRILIGEEELRYGERLGNVLSDVERGYGGTTPGSYEAGTELRLEASDPWRDLIENTGRMEFFIKATDSDLAESATDLAEERRKVTEWIEANPELSIADYNTKLATENPGTALGRLRWFPRPKEEADEANEVTLADRLSAWMLAPEEDWRFTGADVAFVGQSVDEKGLPAVRFQMREAKAVAFERFTDAHVGEQMAIIINDEIATDPVINQPLPGGGIISGGVTGFKLEEVQNLVKVLRTGSLRIKPEFEDEEVVGATLGHEYVRRGTLSAVLGLVAVLFFIALYYRRLGLFASLSLVFNLVLLMGAMSLLRATLTLPGIAGIILTVGMAVDANILIYERIREEALRGRRPAQAAKDGFRNALSTILDANITTLITGYILFSLGTGPVRGFATTLCIGILTSVFSALVFTRVLVHFQLERGIERFSMMRLVQDTKIGFMSLAKKTLPVSVLAMIGGVALFSVLPAESKLGIDFVGGNTMTIATAQPHTTAEVRDRVGAIGGVFRDAVVQEIRSSTEDDGYTRFRLEFKGSGQDEGEDAGSYRAVVQRELSEILTPGPYRIDLGEDGVRGDLYFEQGHDRESVLGQLEGAGLVDVTVEAGRSDREWSFTAGAAGATTRADVENKLAAAFNDKTDRTGVPFSWAQPIPQSAAVGPQVVQELRDKAIFAILVSLFAIVLYIRVRFAEYSYGFAAVAALVHDVLVTLGFLSIAIWTDLIEAEINLAMIAAFLTIIGYSLNDTIVVFDRVRENLPRMKGSLAEVIDKSINQCLARTLLTSMTTLIAVLFLFGFNVGSRNVLEGFSFALIIGVFVGTYSSMFIASPALLWLESRRGPAEGEESTTTGSPAPQTS